MTQGINTQEEQNTCAADASAREREMALVRSSAAAFRALDGSLLLSHGLSRSSSALRVRSFSSLTSPPSMAVVYDRHGAPDAVMRSDPHRTAPSTVHQLVE